MLQPADLGTEFINKQNITAFHEWQDRTIIICFKNEKESL